MKVYIAGPMRGLYQFNAGAFREAAKILRERGIEVVSPLEMDEEAGIYVDGLTGHETLEDQGFDIRGTLSNDLHVVIYEVDAVVMLPGWHNSNGARAEFYTARSVGKQTWELFFEREETPLTISLIEGER